MDFNVIFVNGLLLCISQGPKGDKGDTIQSAAQVAGDGGGVPEGYIQGPPGPPGVPGAPGKKVRSLFSSHQKSSYLTNYQKPGFLV